MSSRSSVSNNPTEFIYQRNNCSRNSWEVSETPSCENLVLNRGFPYQTSMDCQKKLYNSHNSSTIQEDESPHQHLCEFHQRIIHHRSPKRSHHVSKCSANSEGKFNQDYATNSTRQLEELTPLSCRANSYPERICRSIHQDRLNHAAKCSASSKNVEGVEIKRNIARTPRSVYTKQPVDAHPQDVRGNTNEGCCKHSSPSIQSPRPCPTPISTDSGPEVYEHKSSKKFCESNSSAQWTENAVQFPSSSYKKQCSFDEDVSQEYSRTKAKQSSFDPYTTTDFFTKSCGGTTVQTLQEVPLDRNCRSPKATNEMDLYCSKLRIDTEKPCSSCIRRRSSRKDSLQNAFKEGFCSRNANEDMMRLSSCNKPNISKCMSAREMPCEALRASGKQCCPFKCPSQPPLKVSFTSKPAETLPSRENVQLKKQVLTKERVTSDFNEDNVPRDSKCVEKIVEERKRSVMFEADKPSENRDFSAARRLKFCDSVEKTRAEEYKQKDASPITFAKKSCEQIALKLLNVERPKFPGPRCLLGVSFDDAIIDVLSCFQVPEAAKACKASKSVDSQVKLKLLTWLNEQYEALGQDCIEAKSKPKSAESSLSSESLVERKRILDSLSRLIGVKKERTSSSEEQLKRMNSEPRRRSMGSKVEEADLESTNDVTINRTDANYNYLDRFPYRKRDKCSKKFAVSQPSISPANTCSFSCSTNENSSEGVSNNKQEPCLSKLDENEVRLSVDFNQSIRLRPASQRSPETERSSGYHSDIFEHGSRCGTSLANPDPNLESGAFNDALFKKSTTGYPSSNISTNSETSENYRNTVMQPMLPRYSKPSSRANDALSRITERSSEMRSTDEDFRKTHRLTKSSVSFREDQACRELELEKNCPETGIKQEPKMPHCQQITPRSILRQCTPEQANEVYANTEPSSEINEQPNLVYIRGSKQFNTACSPECVGDAAKMFMEHIKQSLQMCTKPNFDVCESKHRCETVRTNKDRVNTLQNEVLPRNSDSAPPCVVQYNGHNRKTCPTHSTQRNNGSLQQKTSVQNSVCPCSKEKLSYFYNQTKENMPCPSQNLSNRESRRNFRDVLNQAKSEYFQTGSIGQSIPNQQFLCDPKVISSNDQHFQPSPAKRSQFQITSGLDYQERGQQPTGLSFPNSTRAFKAQCIANPSSSETTKDDNSICTEDYSSRSETCSQSPYSCEADIDPTQQIGISVKLQKPFEVAHISYSRTIKPKQNQQSQKVTCSKPCEGPAKSFEQEQHRSSLKRSSSNTVVANTGSICHSMNKGFIDDQNREKYKRLSVLQNSSQYGDSGFKASEALTSESTWLMGQFPENYRGGGQMSEVKSTATQRQSAIIEASNSIPSVIEDFPDDQEQPHETIYINSEEELSFCEASYPKAREVLASSKSFDSTEIGRQDRNVSMSLRSYDIQEPISINKTSFKRNGCLQDPSSYRPSCSHPSKDIDIVTSYATDISVDFADNADMKPIESVHLGITEELSKYTTSNSNPREGLGTETVEKISERETFDESFQYGNEERGETSLFNVNPDKRSSDVCVPATYSQKLPESFASDASEPVVESISMNEQVISSKAEKSTDREIRKEICDEEVQMYTSQNPGTENNDTAAFRGSRSYASRIIDTCVQKCSKMARLKTEPKKLQVLHRSGMPCQSAHPCEVINCSAAPKRHCQVERPKEFCCELHHKDNSMCIYIDLCKCKGINEQVGLYAAHKLKTFRDNSPTRPYLVGSGGPSCTGDRTEEDNFGGDNRASERLINRTLSTQKRKECENYKQSIPKEIKWAVAKISVFDDSSKTYELMQAQPIKPIKSTPNSESVVIIVPENHN